MKIMKKLTFLALTLILSLTLVTLSPVSAMASAPNTGGTVIFGEFNYYGFVDGNHTALTYDIEWQVLDVQGDMMLLLSNKLLFKREYHSLPDDAVTWEVSSLRKYLNEDFYNSTFSADEKARIVETTVINKDNQWYGTPGGNNTVDKVFLLSLEEVVKYLGDSGKLANRPGEKAQYFSDEYYKERLAPELDAEFLTPDWWLRSPGGDPGAAAFAGSNVDLYGSPAYGFHQGVRPAMWVKLDGAALTQETPAAPVIDTAPVNAVSAAAPADTPASSNYNPGDYLGDVLYSDIVAYINGYPIPTSATNGRTMVVAEDLANYGFTVIWDAASWSLSITPGSGAAFTPLPVEQNLMPVGAVKCPYVYTTVKTYLSGVETESFAIDGRTLIDFELLAKYGQIEWSNAERSLRLTVN
jgi:hypothetical protein